MTHPATADGSCQFFEHMKGQISSVNNKDRILISLQDKGSWKPGVQSTLDCIDQHLQGYCSARISNGRSELTVSMAARTTKRSSCKASGPAWKAESPSTLTPKL